MKDQFFTDVNIDSLEEKHEEFFDKTEAFKTEIEDFQQLYQTSKFLFHVSTNGAFYLFKAFLYLIAVAINVLFLIFWDETDDDFSNSRGNVETVIMVLSIISISLSGIILIFWFLVKYPTKKKIKFHEYEMINNIKPNLINKLELIFIHTIFMNKNFSSFFMNFFFSILGLTVNPFFYTILLLLIVHLSNLVNNVAMSFLVNYDKLFFTLVIILVVINSFSYLLADFYRN